jgi:hypothetical protein
MYENVQQPDEFVGELPKSAILPHQLSGRVPARAALPQLRLAAGSCSRAPGIVRGLLNAYGTPLIELRPAMAVDVANG